MEPSLSLSSALPVALILFTSPVAASSVAAQQVPPELLESSASAAVSEAAALPASRTFARAVEADTRTLTGLPGPRYWQQRVDYRIHAEVDISVPELQGRETITYHNNSPNPIDTLGLPLEQNVMKPGAPRGYAMPVTGGMTLSSLRIAGQEISLADTTRVRPAYLRRRRSLRPPEVGTLVWIALPRPIQPGGREEIAVAWSFIIPPDWAPRMGMQDSTTAQIAQWFPQVAVYDDLHGWDRQLYLGTGEFYDEYGDFDVTIRVPAGFVVAATGILQNPGEVLTREGRGRLKRAARSGRPVRVLGAEEFGVGRILAAPGSLPAASTALAGPASTAAGARGQAVAWRFRAEDVRDFAFAASDHYQWDAMAAVVDSASGRKVMVHAFWRPDRPHAEAAVEMGAHAVAYHSAHIAPYLYPQVSVSEGGTGGMEYPMIVFVEAYKRSLQNPDPAAPEYSLIAHEIGHEWFPMMVGSNETAYGWQDEGITTFRTLFASLDYNGRRAPDMERMRNGYIPYARQ